MTRIVRLPAGGAGVVVRDPASITVTARRGPSRSVSVRPGAISACSPGRTGGAPRSAAVERGSTQRREVGECWAACRAAVAATVEVPWPPLAPTKTMMSSTKLSFRLAGSSGGRVLPGCRGSCASPLGRRLGHALGYEKSRKETSDGHAATPTSGPPPASMSAAPGPSAGTRPHLPPMSAERLPPGGQKAVQTTPVPLRRPGRSEDVTFIRCGGSVVVSEMTTVDGCGQRADAPDWDPVARLSTVGNVAGRGGTQADSDSAGSDAHGTFQAAKRGL